MDIGRYKFSSKWQDRWENAEAWFATVLHGFRESILQKNLEIGRELEKEFYVIEQFCSRTKPDPMEAYSWEEIVQLSEIAWSAQKDSVWGFFRVIKINKHPGKTFRTEPFRHRADMDLKYAENT